MNFEILTGDNKLTLKTLADNSVDAIITDPPYGIDFLGRAWDANTGALETYTECLRVLKPGGHILAFSAARTYHHLAITLEQAGFEIRDQIMWIYSSGFPKAQDIGKGIQRRKGVEETKPLVSTGPANGMARMTFNQSEPAKYAETRTAQDIVLTDSEAQAWEGWKTALKPAHEPICMARKPLKGSTIDNVLAHGVGALNIDAARVPYEGPNDKPVPHGGKARQHKLNPGWMADNTGYNIIENPEINPLGRFPSNVLGEIEGYQKFFYCPKVSRRERHTGFDTTDIPTNPEGLWDEGVQYQERKQNLGSVGNNHPTVKPVALMRYLIQLITPANGTVLDPFTGSGSTGMAAVELGHRFIGCELDPDYVRIAETRIRAWNTSEPTGTTFEELFE